MNSTVLSVKNLSKHFGRLKAVDELSLFIEKGNIYGILGPNGSGKTTFLGLILDVINRTSGDYTWFNNGNDISNRKKIGAILETPNFYPYLSAQKNLEIIADIKEVDYSEIDEVLDIVDLSHRRQNSFRTYSLGMKQRLAIAAALLGSPEVLILDEPTNGLDPQGIAEIRNLILKVAKRGITIILASHLLDEVQKVCSHVSVLNKGKSIFNGRVHDVLNDSVQVELAGTDNDSIKLVLKNCEFVEKFEEENDIILVNLKDNTDSAQLSQILADSKIVITHISQRKKSLENYFLELLAEEK